MGHHPAFIFLTLHLYQEFLLFLSLHFFSPLPNFTTQTCFPTSPTPFQVIFVCFEAPSLILNKDFKLTFPLQRKQNKTPKTFSLTSKVSIQAIWFMFMDA